MLFHLLFLAAGLVRRAVDTAGASAEAEASWIHAPGSRGVPRARAQVPPVSHARAASRLVAAEVTQTGVDAAQSAPPAHSAGGLKPFVQRAAAHPDVRDSAAAAGLLTVSAVAAVQMHRAGRLGMSETAKLDGQAKPGGNVGAVASTLNIVKTLLGSGLLALPSGIAAFSASHKAVVPSLGLLAICASVSAYTFSAIARVAAAGGAQTFRGAWTQTFGESSGVIPDAAVVFMTAAAVLSYSIIIGDSFAAVAQLCNAPAALASSNAWIVLMSGFVLLPLSLMRDMSRLAIGSVIGTCGTLYTVLFVWLRLLDGSYFAGGRFFEMLPLAGQPAFASPTLARPLLNPGIFVLLSMLPSAFGAHFNAARFYSDLAEPADGSSKLSTFHRVCAAGFGFAGMLTAAVMSGGFFTFGSAAKGLILNNYATADPLALLARVGIGVSMVFSYPLVFTGLRDGVLAMLKKEEAGQKPLVHVGLTVAMLALLNGTSLVVKDLGLVVALGGAILGSATVYILPALMMIFTKKCAVPKAEKVVNALLAILGVFFAGVGTRMCFV